jgi:hypothetical protein
MERGLQSTPEIPVYKGKRNKYFFLTSHKIFTPRTLLHDVMIKKIPIISKDKRMRLTCKCPIGIWIIISPLITQKVKTILHRPWVTSPLIIFDLKIAPGESLGKLILQSMYNLYNVHIPYIGAPWGILDFQACNFLP